MLVTVLVIIVVSIQEHDHVGILLDGPGLSQVREHRALVRAALVGTGELGQAQDRYVELLCHDFQGTADVCHHLLAVLPGVPGAAAGGLHQL